MIKASELRIGNRLTPLRVLDPQNTPLMGYKICAAHIAYNEEELNYDWAPILLTPEILEKLGFENKGDWEPYAGEAKGILFATNRPRLEIIQDHKKGTFHRLIAGGNSPDEYGWYDCQITYLHQLQNLFFALSGVELEVKL